MSMLTDTIAAETARYAITSTPDLFERFAQEL